MSASTENAADTVEAATSALSGKNLGSLGQKVALASAALQLLRKYPVATLIVGGLVLALYVMRREAAPKVTVH